MKKLTGLLVLLCCVAAVGFAAGEAEQATGVDIQLSEPGTYPIVNEKVTIDVFTVYNTAETSGNREDAAFTAWFEDLTNVHVNWVETVPSQNAIEKINLILASQDLPEAFTANGVLDSETIFVNGRNGTFVPLQEHIEERMPNLQTRLAEAEWVENQITMPDGNIYSLPSVEGGCYHCRYQKKMWIYQPWLDALDLEMPTTTEEFYQVLKAFKEQDPNGNGQADEIPLMGATDGWNTDPIEFIMNAFIYTRGNLVSPVPAPGDFLKRDGSTLSFVANTPEWRAGIEYMNKMYEEELIALETFVQKQDQLRAAYENPGTPIIGAVPAGWWGVFSVNGGGTGRYADVMPVPPLEGPQGVRQAAYVPVSVRHQVQITKEASSPALIAQWADWFYGDTDKRPDRRLLSGNFDQEGEHWRMLTEEERQQGLVSRDGSPATWIRLASNNYGNDKFEDGWRRSRPVFEINSYGAMPLEWKEDRSKQQYWLMAYTRDIYAPHKTEHYLPSGIIVPADKQDELSDITEAVAGIVKQFSAAFITGSRPLNDETWNDYVAALENAGVERYVDIWQEALSNAGY